MSSEPRRGRSSSAPCSRAYYLWGAISGSLALPAFVAGPLCFHEYRGIRVAVQAMAILACILIMLYGANSLVPEINRARDAGASGHDRFVRLHHRSVWLNSLVLLVGLMLLVAFAARPIPRTAGILELTPGERARYDAALGRVIEDVEVRHGLRPDGGSAPREAAEESEPRIDAEVVKEIESYYNRSGPAKPIVPAEKTNRPHAPSGSGATTSRPTDTGGR